MAHLPRGQKPVDTAFKRCTLAKRGKIYGLLVKLYKIYTVVELYKNCTIVKLAKLVYAFGKLYKICTVYIQNFTTCKASQNHP